MSLENKSFQSLVQLQTVCLKQNIPFASYRVPLHSGITSLVQHQSFPEKTDLTDQLEVKSGFMIAPFVASDRHSSYLLKPDDVFLSEMIKPEYIEGLSQNNRFLNIERPSVNEFSTTSSEDFIQQVNDAKVAIGEGAFHKVVLSKVRVEEMEKNFEAPAFFLRLCSTYPHAFVYLVQLPGVGCWIGATPEPLLVLEDGKVKTVSLAGTQIATTEPVEAYRWSEKEIEEQSIVTGFVEKTLQSLNIEHYSVDGPGNYKAANLIHLKTGFEFEQSELGNRFGDFLKAIHPTPSVGGLPRNAALDFIATHEKYDRSYYSGFLGPLNIENTSRIFVNLRCLQLFEKQVVLYSGAGITAASVAEREWEETDNKMMTMMNVMKRH